MTFDFTTPMDRAADVSQQNRKAQAFPWRRFVGDGCYIFLRSSAFAVTTFLMTLGLPLFFFLLISGWNMDLLFLQLDNIANRYLGAETARQLAFSGELQGGFFLFVLLIAIWRTPRFVADLMRTLDEGKM